VNSNSAVTRTKPPARGSIMSAINWMGGLTLLLFWLPVLGPLIAGVVGGWKAGSAKRAIIAVFLPAVLIGVLVAVAVGWLMHGFFWGLLAGFGGVALSLLNIGPLLLGALAGGLAAQLS
jgi:hypothetical protein